MFFLWIFYTVILERKGFENFLLMFAFTVELRRAHSAVSNTLKTLPIQSHEKFNFKYDQSTHLTILVEKLAATFCYKWSKFRPKNGAYFIKGAYTDQVCRSTNFRKKFVSWKMFATICLKIKVVSNFRILMLFFVNFSQ